MTDHHYLYALTWADARPQNFGLGVDPRYRVELICCGRLAGLASRVGLDQFDVAKLEQDTVDLPWLGRVALRHNEIINALALQAPVLPLRMGAIFVSRRSLIAKVALCGARASDFLRCLEDRQEWAVKLYLDEEVAREAVAQSPAALRPAAEALRPAIGSGSGASYLAAKGRQADRRRQVDGLVKQATLAVESRVSGLADAWQRLPSLGHTVTNRPQKMVWNGAFLLGKAAVDGLQAVCELLRREWAPQGLMVEVSGPWPPYHFCPSLEPQQEGVPCRSTC